MPEDQGQPTGAAFGFPEDSPAEDLVDPLEGLGTEPEAPEAPQEEPGEPEPEPQEEQPAEEGEPSEEAPEEEAEAEKLWAGRYKSPEELEEGYRHSQRQYSRVTQRAQDAADRNAQLEEGLRRAIALNEQMAQQLQARQQQQAEYGYEEQPIPPSQVPGVPGVPGQQVQKQIEEFREEIRAEAQRERAIRDAEQTVEGFRRAHPEVALNGPEDTAMAELIEDLSLDVGSSDVLETALEAAKDPNLARVIRAQPDLLGSPEGIEHAKLLAGFATTKGANPQRTAAQKKAASTAEAAERQKAHVETGGPGVPPQAPDARPKDAIDEMLEIAKKDGRRSVFTGG